MNVPKNLPEFMSIKKIRKIYKKTKLTEDQCKIRYAFMCQIFKKHKMQLKNWEDFSLFVEKSTENKLDFIWEPNFQEAIKNKNDVRQELKTNNLVNSPYIYPHEWQWIILQYTNKFDPATFTKVIKPDKSTQWLWPADTNKQIDITNWKVHWERGGLDLLLTMNEINML